MKLIPVDENGTPIRLGLIQGDETTARMIEVFNRCITLQRRKGLTYKDAYRSQGYMGNLGRVLSKATRLKNMLWCDSLSRVQDLEETVEDTAVDMINLLTFFLINEVDGNKWGS